MTKLSVKYGNLIWGCRNQKEIGHSVEMWYKYSNSPEIEILNNGVCVTTIRREEYASKEE